MNICRKKKRKHLQRVQDDALTAFEADANNLLAATKKNCGKIVAKTVKRIDAHATSIADFQKVIVYSM